MTQRECATNVDSQFLHQAEATTLDLFSSADWTIIVEEGEETLPSPENPVHVGKLLKAIPYPD